MRTIEYDENDLKRILIRYVAEFSGFENLPWDKEDYIFGFFMTKNGVKITVSIMDK